MIYFKLYECLKPVKGAKNTILMDLQRNNYWTIDDQIYEVITMHNSKTKDELLDYYDHENLEIIFNNLIENEIGFLTDNLDFFPLMEDKWMEPWLITNAIIDLKKGVNETLIGFLNKEEILKFQTKTIQIRIYFDIELNELIEILDFLEQSTRITSYEILNKYNPIYTEEFIKQLSIKYKRLAFYYIYDAESDNFLHYRDDNFGIYLFSKNSIIDERSCGIISTLNMVINIKNYTESIRHNSCLNRKISIDADGNIKNCPSMKESFGNIKDTTLSEAIEKPGFKKYWDINKDKIHVCKDCEFRYICTDCRAYVEDPDDILSKPLKCGYNPYTGEWSEWSTNPLKQKAIDFYGMREMLDELKNEGIKKEEA